MFKQKLIPLMGAALLLVGCGEAPAIEININVSLSKQLMYSEKFEAKKDAKYSFIVDFEKCDQFETESNGGRVFAGVISESAASLIDFLNADKDYSVTYNDKKMTLYPSSYESWSDAVYKKEEGVNDTFIYSNIDAGELKGMMLSYCHFDPIQTDKISITFKSKNDSKDVNAFCLQDLTL